MAQWDVPSPKSLPRFHATILQFVSAAEYTGFGKIFEMELER